MKEINDENLEEFLESIGFTNECCGCPNSNYSIDKPFYIQEIKHKEMVNEN